MAELLQKGHMRESHSPCVVLALVSPKKDGSGKMCVNSCVVNKIIVKCHEGLFECLVMPFGLSNAFSAFRHITNLLLGNLSLYTSTTF